MIENKRKKTALITGPTSGIGFEFVSLFAEDNIDLVLVARRQEILEKIKKDVIRKYKINVVIFPIDLSVMGSAEKVYKFCLKNNLEIDYLVNNAGFGAYGFFSENSIELEKEMIQLNITSLTELTKYFSLDMKKRGFGKIMNVASTASFQPGPLMSVYCATKHYVVAFSEAIAEEFKNSGVSITTLCPGPTISGFQKRAGFREDAKLFNSPTTASSKQVALFGYKKMMNNKRIVIYGFANKLSAFFVKFLPSTVKTYVVKKVFKYYH